MPGTAQTASSAFSTAASSRRTSRAASPCIFAATASPYSRLALAGWKQTWVDNEGGYLDFIGEFKDGQMVLAREAVRRDGSKVQQRMVFKNIGRNEFDWSWERSLDGGKTWEVLWPIHYKRKGYDQNSSSSHEWAVRRLLVPRLFAGLRFCDRSPAVASI